MSWRKFELFSFRWETLSIAANAACHASPTAQDTLVYAHEHRFVSVSIEDLFEWGQLTWVFLNRVLSLERLHERVNLTKGHLAFWELEGEAGTVKFLELCLYALGLDRNNDVSHYLLHQKLMQKVEHVNSLTIFHLAIKLIKQAVGLEFIEENIAFVGA